MFSHRAVICWFVLVNLSHLATTKAASPRVEVIAEKANVKVAQETIAVVKKGETYPLLKTQGAWVAIVIGEGEKQKRGWILASAVKQLADPAITEETAAPAEPMEVRVAVEFTQVAYGGQLTLYFKISIGNETLDTVDFKVADLELKVDGKPLPKLSIDSGTYSGYPIVTSSSTPPVQPSALSFLKDVKLAASSVADGWLAFNLSSLQQEFNTPGGIGNKTWILEGKVGTHQVRFDLKGAELGLIAEKLRPSTLDGSVKVLELGPRVNALNVSKLLEMLKSVPAGDRGCVLVFTNKECHTDYLAMNQLQQQMYQIINTGVQPVVSNEGGVRSNYGYGTYFSNGQIPIVASETEGVLTILGRRPNSGATLIKHLEDKVSGTRAAAARALAQHLVEDGVVTALVKATTDTESNVRIAAVSSLGGQPVPTDMRKNGSIDTKAIIQAMSDSISGVRMTAAHTAAVFACDDARAALIKLLDDADIQVKTAAATSLGTLQARDAIPKLKQMQADSNPQVKTVAIDAQVKIGELTLLAGALAKLDGGTLQDADYSELGKARDKRAVEPLLALLHGNDNYRINFVARTLGEIGDMQAVEPLIQRLAYGGNNYGVAELPRALGKLGDKRAIEPLRRLLKAPAQEVQQDLRFAIYEALMRLKDPRALEEVAQELTKMKNANQHYQATPLLQALGRSRDGKAAKILEPFLDHQQSCQAAAEALIELGSKDAVALLESRLTSPQFPNAQFILNRRWTRTAASIALLKKVAASENPNVRNAALQALNNLQPADNVAANPSQPAPIGYVVPDIKADAWINDAALTPAELRGKVLLISLPGSAGVTPELLVEGNKWLEKFEKQGLVVLALWKYSGWDWNEASQELVLQSEAAPQQEFQAVTAFAKARGIKYPVGLVRADNRLVEHFGKPTAARIALVDRAGVLQVVQVSDAIEFESTEFESLIAELLAEPPPSASEARIPRQTPIPLSPPNARQPSEKADLAASFDPEASSWTIPAHDSTIWSVRFAPDGKTIATTSEEGTARLWDVATGKLRHTLGGHSALVRHCVYTSDGKQILTSSMDRTIRVWDTSTGAAVATLTDDAPVFYLSLLGDDTTVISASQDTRLRYWHLGQGRLDGHLSGHTATCWTVASATVNFTSTIVSGSSDRTVRIWDYQSGETRRILTGHQVAVNAVAISGNATTVASGDASGEVIIWNAANGIELQRIPGTGPLVYDVAFSPDHKALAVGRSNHTLSLYEVATGKLMRQWNRGGWTVHFSRDGKLLATGSDDRNLRYWKVTKVP